jgi:glycosyltransferase involved in cell wall biosynthesis
MLKNTSIICFANDFRGDPTSKQQVMRILSENNKILWVNSIAMRKPSVSASDMSRIWSKLKSFFRGLDQINPNLYAFTPLVLPLPSSRFAQVVNRLLLLAYLKFFILKLGMKNIQLWTFLPNMVSLIGSLNEEKVVYYCVDEWSEFSFLDRDTVVKLERELLAKSDLVITTANKLYTSKLQYNPNTHLVPHGVDFDFFANALAPATQEPRDISGLPHPRIGFFGLIHEWVDLELIAAMATRHPEWTIVMIGKVVPEKDTTCVDALSNVVFLGQKDYAELPGYCKGLDVALIPFVLNELTLNVNPIKLREYLAAGLPVVSTALPEIFPYQSVVHISKTTDEFIRDTEKAVTEKGADWIRKRHAAVSHETWRARVEQISDLVEKIQR